ncbi:MAG: DUF6603 domain-containing protein [Bacteroidota bacterium]
MSAKDNILNIFFTESANAFATLEKHLLDADSLSSLMGKLGYTPPAPIDTAFNEVKSELQVMIPAAEDLVTRIKNGGDTDAGFLNDIITLITATNDMVNTIQQLPAKVDILLNTYGTYLDDSGIKNNIAIRIIDYLLINFLADNHPRLYGSFRLIGIIDISFVEKDDYNPDYYLHQIHWNLFEKIFTDPKNCFETAYGWGTPDLDMAKLFESIKCFAWSNGLTTIDPDPDDLQLDASLQTISEENNHLTFMVPVWSGSLSSDDSGESVTLYIKILLYPYVDQNDHTKNAIIFIPFLEGIANASFEVSPFWQIKAMADVELNGMACLRISPATGIDFIFPATQVQSTLRGQLIYKNPDKITLLGVGSFALTAGDISLTIEFVFGDKPEFIVKMALGTVEATVSAEKGDSFIQKFIKDLVPAFDIGVGYSSRKGVFIVGGASLKKEISLHLELGPFTIETVTISIEFGDKGGVIPISLYTTFSLKLGPLFGIVEEIGVDAELGFMDGGKFGNIKFDPKFKPPNGVGLSLDTAPVKAGGYLKINPDEYIGALEIEIKSIQLAIKAIAIINTRLPGGEKGFSLLVIITAEFSPIQITFGFTLNGLGGLFGYRREMRAEELRLGIKTKTLDSILFPKNVIANIVKVVADLKRVFPATNAESFLIGPMIKIGWGSSLVTAEIGIIIQIPDPILIAILGVIRLQLPTPDEAVLKLQINFIGIIDFQKKLLSIDASLDDSRILVMTITGQFALRIGWGSPGVFIFSSGGFHPDFKEAPAELQHMDRLGIMILNEKDIKLGAGTYFALTTNTVQIGAQIRFWAQSGGYTVLAEVGFDALIQFSPFFFSVAIYLTGRITGPMIDIVIDVRGNLSGPNIWHVWGYAHARVVFFEITIPFDKKFGEPIEDLAEAALNVLNMLKDEVPKSTNWKTNTAFNSSPGVSLREIVSSADTMIVHPNTVISFNQRVAPFGIQIEKFGNRPVDGDRLFTVTAVKVRVPVNTTPPLAAFKNDLTDAFAPGNFFVIPKDKKLARPSFEQMKSGKDFTLGSNGPASGTEVEKEIRYEITYLRNKKKNNGGPASMLDEDFVLMLAAGGAAAKSKLSNENTRESYQAPPKIKINRPGYIVANKADLKNAGTEEYGSQTEAYTKQTDDEESETLILSTHEI